jgi:very-short-patch-repair endonuclease
MALQLHTAPHGFLSGPTAALLRGVTGMPRRRIYATIPRRDARQRARLPAWARRTESRWHTEADVTMFDGLRVERPLPMLASLASLLDRYRFRRAAECAWKLELFTPPEADAFLADWRGRGRSGVQRLERWLDETRGRVRPMQSNFEIDVLDALRAAGLPEPAKQHPLTLTSGVTIHLDLAWPDVRLAVEPGHSRWHDGDDDVESDRNRDNACGELDWHVMRYSERARRNPQQMVAEIARTYRNRARRNWARR